MAIETIASHVEAAKSAKAQLPYLWYVMGRSSAWSDEEIPPAEDMYQDHIDEIIGAKKFEKAQLVRPINSNEDILTADIIYKSQGWKFIADEDAIKERARYLYLEVNIEPGDLPYSVYRQIGIYKNLVPITGAATQNTLRPSEIADTGLLIGYDNRRFQRYDDNVKIKEQVVLKY